MGKIILISCAATKKKDKDGARDWANPGRVAADGIEGLIGARRKAYELKDRLNKRGRNRAAPQVHNGPDFGGDDREGKYFPAIDRYSEGRFFNYVSRLNDCFFTYDKEHSPKTEVLIVSGLYGLLWPLDPIQDYDVDLSDTYLDNSGNLCFLDDYWRPQLTKFLEQRIATHREQGGCEVFDLLANDLYQDAFDWDKLQKDGVEINHRYLEQNNGMPLGRSSGDEALATWGANFFSRLSGANPPGNQPFCKWAPTLEPGQNAVREGVSEHAAWLTHALPDASSPQALEAFSNAFYVLEKCRSARSFNYASACIGLWTGLEAYLREVVGSAVANNEKLCKRFLRGEDCKTHCAANAPKDSCMLHNLQANGNALLGQGDFKPGLNHFERGLRRLDKDAQMIAGGLCEINNARGGGAHGSFVNKGEFADQYAKVRGLLQSIKNWVKTLDAQ